MCAYGVIFFKDTTTNSLTRVNTPGGPVEANDYSYDPSASADGHYVVFWSQATNLVLAAAAASPGTRLEIYIKDTVSGVLTSPTTAESSTSQHPVITPVTRSPGQLPQLLPAPRLREPGSRPD